MERAPETWPPEPPRLPDAAARGILFGLALSSVFWVGLAITLWTIL
ncbi:hypothetical protein [Roseicella aquatilis]|nr:hypothetical protein [Roseicella aquatilis]